MAGKKKNKALLGTEFCEYVWRNGQYWLVNYHTHEGNYCYSYQSRQKGGETERQGAGAVPGFSDTTSVHFRQYGIYEFVKSDNGEIAIRAIAHVDNNVLPQDLLAHLDDRGLHEFREALTVAGHMSEVAKLNLEIAISPQDLGEPHSEEHRHGFAPPIDFGIYEFHRLESGRFTFLPVIGSSNVNGEKTERFFPTDLSAFLDVHHQQVTKSMLEGICAMVLQATGLRLKIIVRSKFIDECVAEGHDAAHGGV